VERAWWWGRRCGPGRSSSSSPALDPAAVELDEGRRFPLCRPEPLRALFDAAGLHDVQVTAIDIPTVFTDFDDLWRPFLGGQGPAPGYCAALPEDRRHSLRNHLLATLVGAENRVTVPDQRIHGRPTAPSSSRASPA
jgi:hypothetical protein